MNRFLFFLSLALVGCSPNFSSYISMDNSQVIYRGFDNRFDYSFDGRGCKKHFLDVQGGYFRSLESDEKGVHQGFFKADSVAETAIISTFCICNTDTIVLKSKSYPILDMPRPQIFLGGTNLTDYSIYDRVIKLDTTGLIAKYISHPAIAHVRFKVLELSVNIGEEETTLGFDISKRLNEMIRSLKTGESMVFNSIKIWYPTNLKEKIYLKREITKLDEEDNFKFRIK